MALRSRGRASRSPTKPGLQVDFDRYVTGQTFVGLQSLVLDNLWQDPSFVRERAVMGMFSKMGYPAPRSSFARVWINDGYQGVYSIVEAIDARFAARAFGAEGYLFEYQSLTPFHAEYLGEQLEPYKERFEAETHERDSDAVLYGPIHDLFREVNLAPDAQWRDTVDRYLDLRAFVTFVAIETFTAEADGLRASPACPTSTSIAPMAAPAISSFPGTATCRSPRWTRRSSSARRRMSSSAVRCWRRT